MPSSETESIQFDLFDGTDWEPLETKEQKLQEIMEEAFKKITKKLQKNHNQKIPGGLIIPKCEHCGCTERDIWGNCKQCGGSPYVIYK